MTLVATPASADANSYLTVADADALAGDDIGPEAETWLRTTTAASKEKALKRATREIDAYVRPGYPRYSLTQPLKFPRADIDVLDGDPIIPRELELATYQQAIFILRNATAIAAANSRRAQNLDSATEPNLGYSRGGDDGMNLMSELALPYLADLGTSPVATSGGIRSVTVSAGFVRTT